MLASLLTLTKPSIVPRFLFLENWDRSLKYTLSYVEVKSRTASRRKYEPWPVKVYLGLHLANPNEKFTDFTS